MALEHILFVLAIIMFVVLVAIWSIHFMALVYGKYKFHKKSKRPIEKQEKLPGVSVLKPLMGVDDNLVANLETFFVMDYPLYELLFCVQDHNDPAVVVVRHLIEKYPTVDAKLFSGGKQIGINPKINNMAQGYDVAKYDLFLISDAGLRMSKDTLYDMVSLMTDKVGLVHQMPFVCDRPGFAGALEKVYFGTCHSRMYLFINLIGINCVTGMSCLMRKLVIDQVGGLKAFGNYIAEDYFLAKTFIDHKWTIQLSHQPAQQNPAIYSVPMWQNRMIRWCKLRLKLTVMSWLEPMQECFMLGLCTSWTVSYLFGWNSLVFFLIHVLAWFLADYMLLKIVQNGKLPFTKFEYVISWMYREGICFYLFLKAASNPTVKWRDGTYRLRWGGLAEEIVSGGASTDANPIVKKSSLPFASGGKDAQQTATAAAATAAESGTVAPASASASPLTVAASGSNGSANTTITSTIAASDISGVGGGGGASPDAAVGAIAPVSASTTIKMSPSSSALNYIGGLKTGGVANSHKRTNSYTTIMMQQQAQREQQQQHQYHQQYHQNQCSIKLPQQQQPSGAFFQSQFSSGTGSVSSVSSLGNSKYHTTNNSELDFGADSGSFLSASSTTLLKGGKQIGATATNASATGSPVTKLKSHHQHHHSISSPYSYNSPALYLSTPQQQQQQNTQMTTTTNNNNNNKQDLL